MSGTSTRVAYVVSAYPAVSHTFILREVRSLRALGADVETISIRPTPEDSVLSSIDDDERRRTFAVLPLTAAKAWRDLLGSALRHPIAVGKLIIHALRTSSPGFRAHIWQLFYVAESLIVWRYLRRKSIRHLHAHFANVGNEVSRLVVRLGNMVEPGAWQYTFTMHGPTEFFDSQRHTLARKVRDADGVACISHYCKSQLLTIAPDVNWEKLRVVHLGVNTTAPAIERRHRPQTLNILCVGRLVEAKGQRVLLDAVSGLRRDGHQVSVTFVGDGPMRSELMRRTDALGLGMHVTFTGSVSQDEIEKYFDDADVFCLPSFSEGLPVALMEAMAHGTPIVTTAIAGVPEMLQNEQNALVVPPADANGLKAALARLVTDEHLRVGLAASARRTVEKEFDLDMSVGNMKAFFEDVQRRS